MRILACTFTCSPPGTSGFRGGEDVLGWNLLKQISRFHEVWTLTHGADRASIELALNNHAIPNLHVCYVKLPRWLHPLLRVQGGHQFYYHLWQIKAYFAARRLTRDLHFDLFHHITYANDWLASFIGALLPLPYVRGPGGGAHRTPRGFEGEYSLKGRLWEKVRALGQWVFRHDPFFIRGQNRARAILLCNHEAMAKLPGKWASKAHLFPVSGVSGEDLAMAAAPKSAGRFRVLSAGTLIRVKGFGLAIKAFKGFAAVHPEASLSIIGSGPEAPRLRALVRSSQLQGRVQLCGAKPRDELLSEMAASDVFLFPSLRDGGGTVVVEAMATGTPVICLDAGGPGTYVTGECGIKVVPHSPQQAIHDLAGALELLYQDEDLKRRLGQAAHQRAKAVYHWDRLGERLMDIYEHSLTTGGRD